MTNSAKIKGDRIERDECARLNAHEGISCTRTLLSSQAAGLDPGDLVLECVAGTLSVEVKGRKEGLKTIKRWRGKHDILIIRPDREESEVVMSRSTFIRILTAAFNDGGDDGRR